RDHLDPLHDQPTVDLAIRAQPVVARAARARPGNVVHAQVAEVLRHGREERTEHAVRVRIVGVPTRVDEVRLSDPLVDGARVEPFLPDANAEVRPQGAPSGLPLTAILGAEAEVRMDELELRQPFASWEAGL